MTVFAEVGYYEPWWIQILKALVIFAVVFQLVPIVLLAERKMLGRFQHRYGPNRVGPFGALQPMADIGKLLFKEQFRPTDSIGWMFALAPAISMFTAVATHGADPVLRHASTSSAPRSASTGSTRASASSTRSRSAASRSTG